MNNQFIFDDLNESIPFNIYLDLDSLLGPLPNNVTPAGNSTTTGSENWTSWNAFDYQSYTPHNRQAPLRQRQENIIYQQAETFQNAIAGPSNPPSSPQSHRPFLPQDNQEEWQWLEDYVQPLTYSYMLPSQQDDDLDSSSYPLFLPQENPPHEIHQNEDRFQHSTLSAQNDNDLDSSSYPENRLYQIQQNEDRFQHSTLRSHNDWSNNIPTPYQQHEVFEAYYPQLQLSSSAGPSRQTSWNHSTDFEQHAAAQPSRSQSLDYPSVSAPPTTTSFPQRHSRRTSERRVRARFTPYSAKPPPTPAPAPAPTYRIIRGPLPESASGQLAGHQAEGSRGAAISRNATYPVLQSQKANTKAETMGESIEAGHRNSWPIEEHDITKQPKQCRLPRLPATDARSNFDAENDGSRDDSDSALCCLVFPDSDMLMTHVKYDHHIKNQKNDPTKVPCPWVPCHSKPMDAGSIYRHIKERHAKIPRDKKPNRKEEERFGVQTFISRIPPSTVP